ncbi:Protein of unknown function [Parapedobacter composti]|uniref:DUF3822 family protein n=1 Tax=Parapedobacter composti TaxID=623281 RepID=A0A1I1GFC6_9SPHI|nr:DUF3822 family protein [Parapedobacter composti]SFC10517.1 Protein of unknown function [Parapedobacter composti]
MMTYTSADFDRNQSADSTLLVRAGDHGSAVAIIDSEKRLQFLMEYSTTAVPQKVADIMRLDFREVKIAVPNGRYAFVPAEVYDSSRLNAYQYYLPSDDLTESVVADVPELAIKLVHQTAHIGLEAWQARFSQARVYPAVEVLLGVLLDYGRKTEGLTIAVDKQSESTSICIFDSGDFIYGNDFEIHHADDLNYYLLLLLQRFAVDRQPAYYLSGQVEEGDDYHQRLLKYSNRVEFADPLDAAGITAAAGSVASRHRFLTLFGLYLCG